MTSIMNYRESPILKMKCQNRKTFNILDSNQILYEKNNALKSIELDDDDDIEEINTNSLETRSPQYKEINNDDNYIVIVSDRNCKNNEFVLEKNIHKLEKYIKNVFKKIKKCKKV